MAFHRDAARLMSRVLVAALLAPSVVANMMDVLHPTMVAPAICKHGCASWRTKSASWWAEGTVPANAGSSCAQPGRAVDSATLGAWCYCAKANASSTAALEADDRGPNPLDGQTKILFNTFEGENKFVSFAYTATPPGEVGAQHWLRATYTDTSDAMPVRFEAAGGRDAYRLFNAWEGYEGYVCAVRESGGAYEFLHSSCSEADALVLTVTKAGGGPGAQGAGYLLQDPNGTYVSFCTSGCSQGRWLSDSYKEADAMTVQLLPKGVTPSAGDWGYCTVRP